MALTLLATLLLVAGCGGGDDGKVQDAQKGSQPPADPAGGSGATTPAAQPGGNTAGGATVASAQGAESLEDKPLELNLDQPIPQDFRSAYQRKALIVVEFFREGEDVFYPQGLGVDEMVNRDLRSLQGRYSQIEFFTYDITEPGEGETSEELDRGQYGTLAAQLEVGYTPFVAMLAPRGERYVIENLFQGYVEEGVLNQALFDLARSDIAGDSSEVELGLNQVELTETGGGVEYFAVTNDGEDDVNLENFSLRAADPETGEVSGESAGVRINGRLQVAPGETVSIGREPDVVDADGNQVIGTFSGGESVRVGIGDQVSLLDDGGAVVDTITVR